MIELDAMLGSLFDEISDGVCASDAEGNILYMNQAAERILEAPLTLCRGSSLCRTLCGRLAVAGSRECASACPLRDPATAQRAVAFRGRHNEKASYEWSQSGFKRVEKWRDLRVRCIRTPDAWADARPVRRFTLIEDISAEMDLERRKDGQTPGQGPSA